MTDYGYARVSTLDQDPALQIDALEKAGCWPIVQEKVSGVAIKRPVRDQVLRQAKAGDTVTCWKLDRWGRSVADLLDVIDSLDRRGIRFRCLTQPIDTTSAFGKMQLTLLAAFAAFERDLLRERVLASKALMKAQGRHPGGPRMFGFERDHQTPIPEEQELIQEAARRLVDGETLSKVVDDWHARGLRPLRGERWRVTSLRRVLTNPRAEILVGDLWRDLQRVLDNRGNRRQHQGRPADWVLSGILTCAREGCGQPMYGTWKRARNGGRELYYRCKKGAGSGGRFTGCGASGVSMARADAWAEEMFVAAIVSTEFSEALSRRQAELLAGEVTAAELDDWRAEITDLEQVMPTRYAPPNARERHAELRRMVDQATAQLLAQPDLQELMSLPRTESKLRSRWSSWSTAERRAWLRRLVERIEVKPAVSRSRASSVEDRLNPVWKL
jgi:DNA invertase Pin-like site-specific DNA recombinase